MGFRNVLYSGQTADNIGGTCGAALKVLWALADEVDVLPGRPQDAPGFDHSASNPSDYTTIAGDIIFKDPLTQGFCEMYVTPKRGHITGEMQGELDSKTYMNKFEFFHPGASDEIEEFMLRTRNQNLIMVIPEADGTQRLYGNLCHPATWESVTFDHLADSNEGSKGQVFTIGYLDKGKPPKLTGAAPMKP